MNQKDYAKAVETYKKALRNNPNDDQTRYNYALAKDAGERTAKPRPKQDQDNKDKQNQDQKNSDNKDNGKSPKDEGGSKRPRQSGGKGKTRIRARRSLTKIKILKTNRRPEHNRQNSLLNRLKTYWRP